MEIVSLNPGEKVFTEKRTTEYREEEFQYTHIGILDANGDISQRRSLMR